MKIYEVSRLSNKIRMFEATRTTEARVYYLDSHNKERFCNWSSDWHSNFKSVNEAVAFMKERAEAVIEKAKKDIANAEADLEFIKKYETQA